MLLADWLQKRYPAAKKTTLKRMVEAGRVMVNGRPARRLKTPLGENDEVRVIQASAQQAKASIAPLVMIYEDDDVLVVLKPAGLLTSTTAREWRPTAVAIVREYLAGQPRTRLGLIHRLDQAASGLLVFSKNDVAYNSLKKQFFEHTVERVYMAVVHGVPNPPSGRIESDLVELADGSVRATRVRGKGEHAMTDYATLKTAGGLSLLRVRLLTGRKHQIRTHLAQRNTPIVGDTVYGQDKDPKGPLLLMATKLAFDHPRTGTRTSFEVPPSREIRAVMAASSSEMA